MFVERKGNVLLDFLRRRLEDGLGVDDAGIVDQNCGSTELGLLAAVSK
jgi:hypothetical protein